MFQDQLLFLSDEQVRETLTPAVVIAIVEDVFRSLGENSAVLGDNSFLKTSPSSPNAYIAMPASLPSLGICGLKWISTYSQPAPGYPFSHGNLIIVNDSVTASPLALVGATEITAMRTAGGHGVVAAKYLSVKEPKTLAVLGCGNQGRRGVQGFLQQFPTLKELRLVGRSRKNCEDLRDQHKHALEVVICTNPADAAKDCDLILMASSAPDILLKEGDICPGTTVIAMDGFRDLDPALTKRADKWVLGHMEEDWQSITAKPMLSRGYPLSKQDVYGSLTDVILGKLPGREKDSEIILFTHMGLGLFDIACAYRAYQLASERGIGQKLTVFQGR